MESGMMTNRQVALPFDTYDVFTDQRFGGNPLAVVYEADGLDAAQMQTIAREFNLSETTFVMAPREAGHRAYVRIFTPANEMPFAGHPTLGTAISIARRDQVNGEAEMILEMAVGPVPVKLEIQQDRAFGRFSAAKMPEEVPGALTADDYAAALGLAPADIGFAAHQPRIFDVGPVFTLLPVRSLEAVVRARISDRFADTVGASNAPFLFFYTKDTDADGVDIHARMFAPAGGVPEDPATGSAVTALAGQLLVSGEISGDSGAWRIAQGVEMGRPSLLHLEADVGNRKLTAVRVAGAAVAVTSGTITI